MKALIWESGFIKLPSSRTLYDDSHFLQSRTGFQLDVVEQLIKEMSLLNINEDWQKYASILFDEIKIKSDLVYDKNSGELVGYVNLNHMGNDLIQLENAREDRQMEKASHILVDGLRNSNKTEISICPFRHNRRHC